MSKLQLPFRQIHLDYHTSELMEDVASKFNQDEFISTLKDAHVDSITCFARCHHGWLYYPSKKFPERIHPNLKNKNILLEQVEVCQKNAIRVPIYVTVQWDNYTAERHPDWLCVDEKGQLIEPLFVPGFYRYLCLNTPYRDFLKEHVKEISEMIPSHDGFFFDILWSKPCCCPTCRTKMEELGYDWRVPEDRVAFANYTIRDFTSDMSEFVHNLVPGCSIYYNDGVIQPDHKEHLSAFTHLEFDALPSGHGSYNNFPIITRTNRTYGLDYAGHTGKFHTGWGDMHSYKTQAALEYECFMLMALGGKCIIGDQLHPLGNLDQPAYDLIGSVYSQVEAKEPWCTEAKPVVEIGLFYTDQDALVGAHKILKESSYQYDIINLTTDFSQYKLIVLPDRVYMEDALKDKLEQYIKNGGKVLATFLSGTDKANKEFLLSLGVKMKDALECDVDGVPVRGVLHFRKDYADYIMPKGPLGKDLYQTEYVMYSKANEVEVCDAGEIMMDVVKPPFYRNMAHYCSHVQTPSYGEVDTPAAVKTERTLYLAHNVFEMYNQYAAVWCKKYVQNAIDYLIGSRLVEHSGPSTMEAVLNCQEEQGRYALHLLHYIPIKRGELLEVIEDVHPLYNITISVEVPKAIKSIKYQPENKPIDFKVNEGRVTFTVPEINGHEIIELDY